MCRQSDFYSKLYARKIATRFALCTCKSHNITLLLLECKQNICNIQRSTAMRNGIIILIIFTYLYGLCCA